MSAHLLFFHLVAGQSEDPEMRRGMGYASAESNCNVHLTVLDSSLAYLYLTPTTRTAGCRQDTLSPLRAASH